jgi:hypothetical protein
MTRSSIPTTQAYQWKLWRKLTAWICGIVALGAAGLYFANIYWPYRYRNVEPLLENVFASKITMDHYRRTYFPHPGFVATGLTLRRKNAHNLPPVGTAEELHVQGEWNDLLILHRSVPLVYVKGLRIVIPPVGSQANHQDFPPGSSMDFAGPDTPVERLHLHNAELDIQRINGGEFRFPIRDLIILNLKRGNTITYSLDMDNAIPAGHIQSHGSFGPLNPKNLGETALSGEFTFSDVALRDIRGISGMLSSYGSFQGSIASIAAGATATAPDFAVGRGRLTPIAVSVHGTINGLNADVVLDNIEMKMGATTVEVKGRVVSLKKNAPKTADFDIGVRDGRVEDLLGPFLHNKVPVTGEIWLHSHAHLVPSEPGAGFLHQLTLEGIFDIPAQQITNRTEEKSLSKFSERAQGKTADVKQDGTADVLSSLNGAVTIRDGIASTRRLTFGIPGAKTNLDGTFDLKNAAVHLAGNLEMQSDILHVTTGWKSFLLKPLIPFFKGKRAGAVIPIAITGRPGQYKVGQNLLHRK